MLSINITETKQFVKKLLLEPVFDDFLFVRADVTSDVTYSIDGRLHPAFFDTDEMTALPSEDYTTWLRMRGHIYNIIKGNKLPLHFKIVLILPDAEIKRLIKQHELSLSPSDVANLSLNIYFDGEKITVTTLASLTAFSLDKSLEQLWDTVVTSFFKHYQII